jgi:signal transduction histidine kinase
VTEFICPHCDYVAFSRNALAGHLSGHARGGSGVSRTAPFTTREEILAYIGEKIAKELIKEVAEERAEVERLTGIIQDIIDITQTDMRLFLPSATEKDLREVIDKICECASDYAETGRLAAAERGS